MTKIKAILLVLAAEGLIYLFLLVGWPVLTEAIYSIGAGTEAVDMAGQVNRGWALYLLPGLFGAGIIVLILRQKEAKKQ